MKIKVLTEKYEEMDMCRSQSWSVFGVGVGHNMDMTICFFCHENCTHVLVLIFKSSLKSKVCCY